jgi:hypothetical protein
MKRSLLHIVILVYLSAGCGSTYQVGGPSGVESVHVAASRLYGEEVTIFTVEGYEYDGIIQALTPYGLAYKATGTDSTMRIPLNSLTCIKHANSKVGTAAPLGGLAGCVIGGAIYRAANPPPEEGSLPGLGPLVYPGIGILAGVAAGTAVGLAAVDTYEFSHDEAPADTVANEKP